MDFVKGILPVFVGVAIGGAMGWLMMPESMADRPTAVVEHLAALDHRLSRLERAIDAQRTAVQVDPTRDIDGMRQEFRRLSQQVASLTHAGDMPEGATGSAAHALGPQEAALLGVNAQTETVEAGIEARQLEPLVADLVASLAPQYLEEQVGRLYAAQKQADEAAQREAEQHRREEVRERRLAQMVDDLQGFGSNLTAPQLEEVAQAIQEQWEVMESLRQKASEQGIFLTPGEILRQAREITDAKLYAVLSGPQLEAFRHWRETRFGAPGGVSR